MADAHYSNVALLLPMNGVDGGTTFTDYAPVPKTVSVYGNTHTETDQSKFYGSSGYFDGSGDYLYIANDAVAYGAGDFTIEFWARLSSYANFPHMLDSRNTGPAMVLTVSTSGKFNVYTNGSTRVDAGTVNTNTWHHFAVCRSINTFKAFLDGTQVGSNWSDSSTYTANQLHVAHYSGGGYEVTGYMQDLRITKGMARYTANFTPPGKLCGTISGTVYDAAGDPAQRTVIAVLRAHPNMRHFATQASAVDGTYSLTVPDVECSRLVLADETTLYNDLVDRVLPG